MQPLDQPLDVLCVAPHPDDAEIGAGGTLICCRQLGLRTGVVDLTDGEPTPHGSPEIRARETAAATEVLGLSWRANLGLPNRELESTLEARRALAGVFRLTRPRILLAPYWDDAHPDHHVVIVTHAYLYLDNQRYDWAARGDAQRYNPHSYVGTAWPEVNDGEEIWQALIAPRANVEVVVSGHVPDAGVGRQSSEAAGGQVVHELLADFQSGPMGGNGYLRLMTFYANRIEVRSYSPYLDAYETTPEHQFVLPWSP